MEELFRIATFIEKNNEKECDAIKEYTEFLENLMQSNLDEKDKTRIFDTISEIISDELNHKERLTEIYNELTGISPNTK